MANSVSVAFLFLIFDLFHDFWTHPVFLILVWDSLVIGCIFPMSCHEFLPKHTVDVKLKDRLHMWSKTKIYIWLRMEYYPHS